jgi:Protein of unknown function (DUF1353)
MKNRIYHILIICLICLGCTPATLAQPRTIPATAVSEVNDPSEKQQIRKPQSPKLKRLKNGHYRVIQPWIINLNGETWRIQAGYKCNGITAPNALKKSLGDGVDEPATWAAIFHDWLFTQPNISRKKADHLFYELMIIYGVPKNKAKLMHATVTAYSISKRIW